MPSQSTGTSFYLSLIGFMIAAAGVVFTVLMWQSFSRAREIDAWPIVPAVVLEADIEERVIDPARPTEFRFVILYAYEWDGESFQSNRLSLRGSSWTSRRNVTESLIDRYSVGSEIEAMVNPQEPAKSVLIHESRAPGYSLWFPLIFVVGGFGVMIGAWRRPRSKGA